MPYPFLFLLRYLKLNQPSDIILSGVLMGLGGWTRSDALLYLVINAVTLIVFAGLKHKSIWGWLIYASVFVAMWTPWNIYWRLAGYRDFLGGATEGLSELVTGKLDLVRLTQVLSYFWERIWTIRDWGLLWLALPLAILSSIGSIRKHAVLFSIICLNIGGLIFTYYSAGSDPLVPMDVWLYTGFDRMAVHIGFH